MAVFLFFQFGTMVSIDRTVKQRYAELVQYFSEKPMAQYLRMGSILSSSILFHLQIIVTDRNCYRHFIGIIIFPVVPVFIQIEERPRLYVDQFRNCD